MHLPNRVSKLAQDDPWLAIVYKFNDLQSKVGVSHLAMLPGHKRFGMIRDSYSSTLPRY